MTTFGFDNHNYQAIVDGVYQAIVRAHENLSTGGRIYMNADRLFFSNINRSPTSYLMNPPEERKAYEIDGDTDKTMVVLRMSQYRCGAIGMLSQLLQLKPIILLIVMMMVLLMANVMGEKIPQEDNNYLIGSGIYDITGPAAEVVCTVKRV